MHNWTFTLTQHGASRNMASWEVSTDQTSHLVEVSWPLTWDTRDTTSTANAIYLVDGNAMFLSATEVIRRRAAFRPEETGTIAIGIGYPLTNSVYDSRRAFDLTPPSDHYTPPKGPDGTPFPEEHGGADDFLPFIEQVVRPFIGSLFPNVDIKRNALFGHSYGGLFVLNALFTRPRAFDVYLAASPSIWWNDKFILSRASRFIQEPNMGTESALRLSYGSREEHPVRHPAESLEKYERRVQMAALRRMAGNCDDLYLQLEDSQRLRRIEKKEYIDEDHGSVISPTLSGGIIYFLDLAYMV
ncbi:Alpha/Beta hydrolase protein [Aspergillus avenaceus]|uniref:Alpha/Beta hydrolase protein n=1 Tax=Aspergillus avenaceus TaxID=36643 RepID=A0A5N6TU24_ASPAV|nr:Alpha/Beta hydrolase protein [Aspergillus avenaceus]